MEIVSNPAHLGLVWSRQYDQLAKHVREFLPSAKCEMVEVGCGRGQFTIPMAKLNPSWEITAVDNFTGPYSRSLKALRLAIKKERLSRRIRVIISDYLDWLSKQPECRYSGVISSEFLCEINSEEMKAFFSECYRVSKPRGLTMHSFLSPSAENERQRLVIEADSDPRWAKYPPKEWFSPEPNQVATCLKGAGFGEIRSLSFRSDLGIVGKASRKTLRDWNVKVAFWKRYRDRLMSEGLEIPDWVVVLGRKLN